MSNSNRDTWQLLVNASEVPLKVVDDGSIEFFGRGTNTPATDKQVYFLINGKSAGLRIAEVKGGNAGENPSQSYADDRSAQRPLDLCFVAS